MRLPSTEHTGRPWRIHGLAPDFELEDVWALPTPGGPDDFGALVQGIAAGGDSDGGGSRAAAALWALRWKLGAVLGWDDAGSGLGGRVRSLRERLPADLRDGPRGPAFAHLPFEPVFLTGDEFAAEIANATVHGVLHLGWVADGDGGFRGQLAVLVRPNGLRGRLYMAAIRPFRHRVVYPPMLRKLEREWRTQMATRVVDGR